MNVSLDLMELTTVSQMKHVISSQNSQIGFIQNFKGCFLFLFLCFTKFADSKGKKKYWFSLYLSLILYLYCIAFQNILFLATGDCKSLNDVFILGRHNIRLNNPTIQPSFPVVYC